MDRSSCSYFYNVSGERARELLFLYGKKGEFLVRPSEMCPQDCTMSIHCGNHVTNVKLPCLNGTYKLPAGDEFLSLSDIVGYLVSSPNILVEKDGTPIEINSPAAIPRSEAVVNVGYDRFFHIQLSGPEAEDLLANEPNGTYLVRESVSNPGEYALSVKNENAVIHVRIYHSEGKFRVVPKDNFSSLPSLLDNYIHMPMVQNGGTAVRLKVALPSSKFTAATVDYRIECLSRATRKNGTPKDGIIEEFEGLHNESESQLFISCKEGRKTENVRKNRYRNVIPYDHTRIKLKVEGNTGDQNDYINANLIEILSENPKYQEFDGFKRKYISTQGCLPETLSDFWKMIWQENSRMIVMLTREVERGKAKCIRYWPNLGEDLEIDSSAKLIVRTNMEKTTPNFAYREFSIRSRATMEARKIVHFQLLSWEDNDTCPLPAVLEFVDEVNRCLAYDLPQNSGPMVVHCSAGIGRTGTFIVLDILINRIKRIGPQCVIDIPKTIRMLREQRTTMVQTEAQYRFIYHAISALMKSIRDKILGVAANNNAKCSPSSTTKNSISPASTHNNLPQMLQQKLDINSSAPVSSDGAKKPTNGN